MKLMKRVVSMALAVSMAASLTACGGGSAKEAPKAEASKAEGALSLIHI